ncbi:MAG: C10 family peptidase [Bacteroidota bacterium]
MKRFCLFLILIIVASGLFAGPVNEGKVKRIALTFLEYQSSAENRSLQGDMMLVQKGVSASYYLYSYDNAWVLMSGDSDMYPVLGFSIEGGIDQDNIPPAMLSYLGARENQAEILKNRKQTVASSVKAWELFEERAYEKTNGKSVQPLLETKWNQGWPYNAACPAHPGGPGGHVYAGCVATAMGQIMKYHEFPSTGRFSNSISWGENIEVDFSSVDYEWDVMGTSIGSQSQEAISTLLFHCGAAVDMNYGANGSGSNITASEYALKYYFKYKPGSKVLEKSKFSDEDWRFKLREDLDKNHPVLYSGVDDNGGGHAFVCDAYQDTSYFHFNWGWSGSGNGYFFLDGISFHWNQRAVFNISPYWGEYCSSMFYEQRNWTFDDGSGPNYYWNDSECEWLIQPDGVDAIRLKFNYFHTGAGDVLYVYDGNSSDAELLGSFSGDEIPEEVVSGAGEVFLKFVTDGDGQEIGWELEYESITTGKDDMDSKKFSLYPNPADKQLVVHIPGTQPADVKIFSSDGRLMFHEKMTAGRRLFDLSDYSGGVYVLHYAAGSESRKARFVVK